MRSFCARGCRQMPLTELMLRCPALKLPFIEIVFLFPLLANFRFGVTREARYWNLAAAPAFALLAGCGDAGIADGPANSETGRWYSVEQVSAGEEVFAAHCAECHGDTAQGAVADWRERLPDGSFPPPPLNGSAHAWHHPLSVLLQVIDEGGTALGGQMPPFGAVLAEDEKLAAIAWFQDLWSDENYSQWLMMGGVN